MEAILYCEILQRTLVLFLAENFPSPTTHRFNQDNDPKHVSQMAQAFYLENGINWFRTPLELPDINPIENVWHELKEFIRREVKPSTKDQLVEGIRQF